MFFEVDKSWEIEAFGVKTSDGQEFNSYPLVELYSGTSVFLLSIQLGTAGIAFHNRQFFVGSAKDVLRLIQQPDIVSIHLNYLKQLAAGKGFSIFKVCEILQGTDKQDRVTYIIRCDDGMQYIDSPFVKLESELKDVLVKYIHSN